MSVETGTRRRIDYKYVVVAAFIGGQFMSQLDSTVINVALPKIATQLNASTEELEWVATGYLLSLAVWVPVAGWIGDRFGTKRIFLISLAMFTAGSLLCAQARNIDQLILFRVIQGVGGGLMMPVGAAMLYRAFPPIERPRAAAFSAIPQLLAPMLGPVFGGYLVDNASWRWIFYINLPVGMAVMAVCAFFLREHKEGKPGRFDVAGFVLSGTTLSLLLFAISRGPEHGWTSPAVVFPAVAGLVLLGVTIRVELTKTDPILNLRLFGNRMFRSTNIAIFMATAGLLGMLFLLPLYLQQLRGYSAVDTGLTTLPQGLGMALTLQVTSRIYHYVGPRKMMATGTGLVAISTACFLFVGLHTSLIWIGAMLFIRGVGIAFASVANQAASFATIDSKDMGRASSLLQANIRVCNAVGVAVLATVLIDRVHAYAGPGGVTPLNSLHAFHDAFLAAFILGIIGVAFSLLIHDEDVAHLLKRRGRDAGEKAREDAAEPAGLALVD